MSLKGSTLPTALSSGTSGDVLSIFERVLSWYRVNRLAVNVSPFSCFYGTVGITGTDLRVFLFFFTVVLDS